EQRRSFRLALDILEAYLEPMAPAELLERDLADREMVRAVLETSPFTRVMCQAFDEIEPGDEEDLEWQKRRQRFVVILLSLCAAWRVTDDPELLREAVAPFSNRDELREKLALIRKAIDAA